MHIDRRGQNSTAQARLEAASVPQSSRCPLSPFSHSLTSLLDVAASYVTMKHPGFSCWLSISRFPEASQPSLRGSSHTRWLDDAEHAEFACGVRASRATAPVSAQRTCWVPTWSHTHGGAADLRWLAHLPSDVSLNCGQVLQAMQLGSSPRTGASTPDVEYWLEMRRGLSRRQGMGDPEGLKVVFERV